MNKDINKTYYFKRIYKGNEIKHAPNIFLITSDLFWDINGYAEDFAGNYGYED